MTCISLFPFGLTKHPTVCFEQHLPCPNVLKYIWFIRIYRTYSMYYINLTIKVECMCVTDAMKSGLSWKKYFIKRDYDIMSVQQRVIVRIELSKKNKII